MNLKCGWKIIKTLKCNTGLLLCQYYVCVLSPALAFKYPKLTAVDFKLCKTIGNTTIKHRPAPITKIFW